MVFDAKRIEKSISSILIVIDSSILSDFSGTPVYYCILLYTIVYYCILLYTCNMLVYHKDQRGGRKQQQASVLKHPHPFRPAALSVGWNTKCLGPEPGATAMWPRNRLNLWEWRWQHPKQPAVPGENPSPELLLWILTWLVGGFNPSEKY